MKLISFFISCGMLAAAMLPTPAVAHPHHPSIPLSKIAKGHLVGDTMHIINTPGSKELPPTALSALGPDWADDSADGFRLVAGSVDTETQGVSPWETDGARPQGQQRFIGSGINTSWTFNTKDGRCHLPDGAVIHAIYATWTQRGRSGATYSYTEGQQSHSANADHESLPHPELELHWTDADDVVRTSSFQRIFSGPIQVVGKDGFTLNAQKMLGKNSHQTDAIVLDVTLNPAHLTAGEMPVADDGLATTEFIEVEAGVLPQSSWAGAQAVDTFHLAKTEVTWAQFQEVRIWAAANGYDIGSVGAGTGPNRPVTNVSWYQALKWCNAWSEKEGLVPVYKTGGAVYRWGDAVPTVDATANGYRLPSEKEWEFAARGGIDSKGYEYSGSNDIGEVAWYWSNGGNISKDVATKQANELGLHDMSGNVYEWCFDASEHARRVGRGGSLYYSFNDYCFVAYQNDFPPSLSLVSIGFRVARNSADGPPLISGDVEAETQGVSSWEKDGARRLMSELIAVDHETPVATEMPVAPGDMEPLDAAALKK
ncbi:MAG: formylglycine-generating enzyme family protein [Haloferula sp.]